MKEILRLSHISCEYPNTLKDFNLLLWEKEILWVTGSYNSGIRALKKLLCGSISYRGRIRLSGEMLRGRQQEKLERQIVCIDENTRYIDNWTITDNIFFGRMRHMGFQWYDPQKYTHSVQRALGRVGIPFKPETRIRELPALDKQLLCIVKAELTAAPVLLIDCMKSAYSDTDQLRLCQAVALAQSSGLSVIVLSMLPNRLTDMAARMLIMEDGTDRICVAPDRFPQLMSGSPRGAKPYPREALAAERPGRIVGIIDGNWGYVVDFNQYFQKLTRGYENLWEMLEITEPVRRRSLVLPENIAERVRYGDIRNQIMLPLYKKFSGPVGVNKPSVIEYICGEVFQKVGISPGVTRMEELDYLQRKLLLTYRWLYCKPELLVLCNPYLGVANQDTQRLIHCIRDFAQAGTMVMILAKSAQELRSLCSRVYLITCGRVEEISSP